MYEITSEVYKHARKYFHGFYTNSNIQRILSYRIKTINALKENRIHKLTQFTVVIHRFNDVHKWIIFPLISDIRSISKIRYNMRYSVEAIFNTVIR